MHAQRRPRRAHREDEQRRRRCPARRRHQPPPMPSPHSANFAAALGKVGLVVSLSGQPSTRPPRSRRTWSCPPPPPSRTGATRTSTRAPTWCVSRRCRTCSPTPARWATSCWPSARGAGHDAAEAAPAPVEDTDAPAEEASGRGEDSDGHRCAGRLRAPAPGLRAQDLARVRHGQVERDFYLTDGIAGDFRSFWIQSLKSGGYSTDALPSRAAGAGQLLRPASTARGPRRAPAWRCTPIPTVTTVATPTSSWAQEVPDPMTGHRLGHLGDRGLRGARQRARAWADNDLVELTTAGRTVQAGVEIYRGVKGKDGGAGLRSAATPTPESLRRTTGASTPSPWSVATSKDSLGNVLPRRLRSQDQQGPPAARPSSSRSSAPTATAQGSGACRCQRRRAGQGGRRALRAPR